MTFFSHRPYSLCFFISLLSEILYITYMAIFFKKSLYFRTRNLFTTHFLLSPHTSENTTSRNIGGTDAWAVPRLKFWGTVPQSSLSLCHISSGDFMQGSGSHASANGIYGKREGGMGLGNTVLSIGTITSYNTEYFQRLNPCYTWKIGCGS